MIWSKAFETIYKKENISIFYELYAKSISLENDGLLIKRNNKNSHLLQRQIIFF